MPKRMLAIAALLGASITCAAVDINLASEAELDGVERILTFTPVKGLPSVN